MPLLSLRTLPEGHLGLWHLSEPLDELCREAGDVLLPAETLDGLKHPQRKLEYAGSRLLLARLLDQQQLPQGPLLKDAFGKPYLPHPPLALSISHTPRHAAILLSPRAAAGVDLEPISEQISRLAPKFLSAAEKEFAQSDPLLLTLCWSAKETVYKLYGRRQLRFAEHLRVLPFEPAVAGRFGVELVIGDAVFAYNVGFEVLDGLVLTYAATDQLPHPDLLST